MKVRCEYKCEMSDMNGLGTMFHKSNTVVLHKIRREGPRF